MTMESGLRATAKQRLRVVLLLTALYLAAEVIGGILTKSLALLADAGHMLADVGGLALALVAIKFAERPPTPERTYGFHRVEILAALANAVLLIGISAFILYEAYERFRHPIPIVGGAMFWVAIVGLLVNVSGMIILRGGSSKNLNVKGAYFEIVSDMLASIAVIAAAIIIWTTGWTYADPILSAGIGLFILPRTWKFLQEILGVLLEGAPSDVDMSALRGAIGSVIGVAGIHDLHVWMLTSGINALSVHVVAAEGVSPELVRRSVRDRIASGFQIGHVTVEVECSGCLPEETHP